MHIVEYRIKPAKHGSFQNPTNMLKYLHCGSAVIYTIIHGASNKYPRTHGKKVR